MAEELTYAMITPYSLLKSRTGGILARMLRRPELELEAVRLYTPSDAFLTEYCQTIQEQPLEPRTQQLLLDYVRDNLRPQNRLGIVNRTVLFLFRGPDAINLLKGDVVGPLTAGIKGDTVRGTYGDFVSYPDGEVKYFEPAVLIAPDADTNRKHLDIFARYAESDGGILEHVLTYPPGVKPETTLVILKPEVWSRHRSAPGHIIDIFSKTGLYVIGAKLLRLSIAQGEKLYEPLRTSFVERLKPGLRRQIEQALGRALDFPVPDALYDRITDLLKDANAECEFHKIVAYMTGRDPRSAHAAEERERPGEERSLALLYQGEDAVRKAREQLGATDPRVARPGTVRSDFGADLMRNGAHASDSPESAERERRVLGLWKEEGPADVRLLIEAYLRPEAASPGAKPTAKARR
jgi:nucleoside diphosphate kinase